MTFNNPLPPHYFQELQDLLWLSKDAHILDVGCGEGDLLRSFCSRFQCRGTGVDPDELALDVAKAQSGSLTIDWKHAAFDAQAFSPASFDAISCVGSVHAFGSKKEAFAKAIRTLKPLLKPSGVLILGHGFWQQPPPHAYLKNTGISATELQSHAENRHAGKPAGMECIYCRTASPQDWDHFEGQFWLKAEKAALQNPDDPKAQSEKVRIRQWKETYWKWGRDTMGFGLYVFL